MKTPICFIILLACMISDHSQAQSKWSLEGSYGLNGNFFVRSYPETGPFSNSTYLYKKNFLGSAAGAELRFRSGKLSTFFIGYNRTVNSGEKNFSQVINGVYFDVLYFKLRHVNDIFLAGYERKMSGKFKNWKFHVGLGLVYPHQQELSVEQNFIVLQERDFKHYNLVEASVFGGLEYGRMIDTKLELALRVRAFYVFSAAYMEGINLTPVLRYHF